MRFGLMSSIGSFFVLTTSLLDTEKVNFWMCEARRTKCDGVRVLCCWHCWWLKAECSHQHGYHSILQERAIWFALGTRQGYSDVITTISRNNTVSQYYDICKNSQLCCKNICALIISQIILIHDNQTHLNHTVVVVGKCAKLICNSFGQAQTNDTRSENTRKHHSKSYGLCV